MINILITFILATLIGIGASTSYGPDNLWQHPWVEQTTWFVIAMGVLYEAVRWVYPTLKAYTKRLIRLTSSTISGQTRRSFTK